MQFEDRQVASVRRTDGGVADVRLRRDGAGPHAYGAGLRAAERFMPYNTMPLVDHDVQRVKWLDDTPFLVPRP